MKKNNKIRVQSAQKGNQRYMFSSTHNNLNNHFKLPNLRKEKTDLNLDSSNIFFFGSSSKFKNRYNKTQKIKLKTNIDILTSENKDKIIISNLTNQLNREIERNRELQKKLENKNFNINELKKKLAIEEEKNNKLIDELHEVYVKYDRMKRFLSGDSGAFIEIEDKLKEEIENHNKMVEELIQKIKKQKNENETLIKKFKVLNSNLDGALNIIIKENDDLKKNINFLEFELDDKKNEISKLEKEIKKYSFLNNEMDKTCGYLIKENKKLKIELITNMNNNN
jgi:chromosome segregation ATPase